MGAVASLAAQLLLESLEDGMVAALSWGKMLQATVEAVGFENERDVTLVQLLGGVSVLSNGASGEELVRALALRLRADYRLLHAPAAMTSAAARGALVGEASISEVIDLARSADVALVGVGDPHRGSSAAVIDAMALAPDDRAGFWEQRPVGDVAGRFFDAGGCPVTGPVDDRVVAVSLEDLRRTPLVAGVVSGRPKTDAVLGALRGGHLDALVCDAALARGLLAASADRN